MVPVSDKRIGARRVIFALVVLVMVAASVPVHADDSLVVLYNNLGVIRALNSDMDGARTYFDSALQRSAENAAVLNNLGNYYLCLGQTDTAVVFYERSYLLDSTESAKLFNWSVALYMSNQVEQSINIMKVFLDGVLEGGERHQFASVMLEDLDLSKGSSHQLTKMEMKKLLEEADKKRKQALKKRDKTPGVGQGLVEKKPEDSGSTTYVRTVPAGEKQFEAGDLTNVLFWVIL